jgi:hypothetical protein
MKISREFFHDSFLNLLVEIFQSKMIDLFKVFYSHSCTKNGNKDHNREECIKNFRKLLTEKSEKVKEDPQKTCAAVMKNDEEYKQIVFSASLNYVKMNSLTKEGIKKRINECDIFCSVFLNLARMFYKYPYLIYDDAYLFQMEELVEKKIKQSLQDVFKFSFINEDAKEIFSNFSIVRDGKILNINSDKLLKLFNENGILLSEIEEKLVSESDKSEEESSEDEESGSAGSGDETSSQSSEDTGSSGSVKAEEQFIEIKKQAERELPKRRKPIPQIEDTAESKQLVFNIK